MRATASTTVATGRKRCTSMTNAVKFPTGHRPPSIARRARASVQPNGRARFTVDEGDREHTEELAGCAGSGEIPERQGVDGREGSPIQCSTSTRLHLGADRRQHVVRRQPVRGAGAPPAGTVVPGPACTATSDVRSLARRRAI